MISNSKTGAKYVCPHCTHTVSSDFGDCVTNEAIISHLSTHKTQYYQCASCNTFCLSESLTLDHILREHPGEKLKFYHNPAVIDQMIYVERISITLECNICNSVFETGSQAIDHFKVAHDNEFIDLTVILMIKRTDANLKTQWSVNEKNWAVSQLFTCLLCCQTGLKINEMIVHHRTEHQSQPLSLKLSETLASGPKGTRTSSLAFCCVHCQNENISSTLFSSVEDVYAHWSKTHTPKPFQFHVAEPIACYHCGTISTFPGLKVHHAAEHPNESIVLHNHVNRKKCAICKYTGEAMIQHFADEHKLIVQMDAFNPVCMSEECLNELISINIHKKQKCTQCNGVFDTDTELRSHHAKVHATIKHEISNRFADQSVYVDCCHIKLTPINYLNHFLYHIMHFECSGCQFKATTLADIVYHDLQMHAGQQWMIYLDLAQLHYLQAKVFFGNGLVLINHNLLHTKYDDSQQCESKLKEMIECEKGKFQK